MLPKKKRKNLFEIYSYCFKIAMVFKKILTIWTHSARQVGLSTSLKYFSFYDNDFIFDIIEEGFENFKKKQEEIEQSLETLHIYDGILNRFTKFINWVVSYWAKYCWCWCSYTRDLFKIFFKNFNIFFFRKVYRWFQTTRFRRIKNIILFKKKTSFFKKRNKIELSFLKRAYMFKFKKSPISKKFLKNRKWRKHMFSKYVDLHKRTKMIFYYNRDFFKKYLRTPKIRQKAKSRTFSDLLKKGPFNFLKLFDNSVMNLMLQLRFVPSLKEAFFLSTSGLIFINGVQTLKYDSHVNYGDVIQIAMSDMFYKFYRWNIHFKNRFFKKIGYHLWMLNRFKFNFYKQSTTRIPDFINRVMFYYEDLPRFYESDFLTLTFIMVLLKNRTKFFSFFFKKIPALNMLRLYNWKYIV